MFTSMLHSKHNAKLVVVHVHQHVHVH